MPKAPQGYACPECHVGKLQPSLVTYAVQVGDQLLMIPNFGAWICDVCGHCDYDENALQWLNTLLYNAQVDSTHRVQPKRSTHSSKY